jgi:2-dehydro-3-deoxygluconokinase
LIIEATQAAKDSGAVVSFDLNFREKLWNLSGGQEPAQRVIGRILIIRNVDVLVGNEEDLQRRLGIVGPEMAAKSQI